MLSVSRHKPAWQQWAPRWAGEALPRKGAENLPLASCPLQDCAELSSCQGWVHALWMLIYRISYNAKQGSWGTLGEQESCSKYCQFNKAPELHGINQSTSDTIQPTGPARVALSPVKTSHQVLHRLPGFQSFLGQVLTLSWKLRKKSSPLSATTNICGRCGNADEGGIHKHIQVQFHETPAGSQTGVKI